MTSQSEFKVDVMYQDVPIAQDLDFLDVGMEMATVSFGEPMPVATELTLLIQGVSGQKVSASAIVTRVREARGSESPAQMQVRWVEFSDEDFSVFSGWLGETAAAKPEKKSRKKSKAVVAEPVVEEPVAAEPVAVEEPVVEEPVAEESVAEESVAEEPVVEEPVVEEPVAEEPVAEAVPVPVMDEEDKTIPIQSEPSDDGDPESEESAENGTNDSPEGENGDGKKKRRRRTRKK